MGFGIVEPVDDFDLDSEQASNPALLGALASDFVKGNYSFKTLVRTARTAQASTATPVGSRN